MIRTRFAPSPTGYLHVGGLRTALYAYLLAKKNNGQFILRIEDTDQKRYVTGAIESILRSLLWAGIEPDEGVVFSEDRKTVLQKGDRGPYIQSERLDLYKKYAQELLDNGYAYYCFCSEERLSELRAEQQRKKIPVGYDGHCRTMSPEEVKKRIATGEKYVIRMKMPQEGETSFFDLVRGEVKFENKLIDDQVIIKSDGFPTYHLAVVVDDHLMGITHVTRAEEWLPSTPKHIQLYKYFNWEIPQFAHLPQLVNKDRTKLSKRQGDVAVEDYIKKGYLAEAMVNFVAFLGWNPGTEKEIYSLAELIEDFSLEKVGKSGSYFNLEKLDWYNREYLKMLSSEEIAKRSQNYFIQSGWWQDDFAKKLPAAISLEKERITTLSELPQALKFIFVRPEYQKNILIWKKSNSEEIRKTLIELMDFLNTFSVQNWNKEIIQNKVGEWIREKEHSNGIVLWPMRVALSGQENSPGPFEIAEVLGKEETIERIKIAVNKL